MKKEEHFQRAMNMYDSYEMHHAFMFATCAQMSKNVISFIAILNARGGCPNKTSLFQSSLLKCSFIALWMLESQ